MSSFILAVSGPTAAGKTHFTKHLRTSIETDGLTSVTISTDEFYKDLSHLTMEERKEVNYDLPRSIDKEAFYHAIKKLTKGQEVAIPIYDFTSHTRTKQKRNIKPADLIIVEGIFSLSFSEINHLYDLKIFIDLDQDLRLIRRIKRDMKERGRSLQSVFNQYLDQVRPSQEDFVANDKYLADIILRGDQNHTNVFNLLKAGISGKNTSNFG